MGVFNPRDGRNRWISINAVPQFNTGEKKPYGAYTTFSDITELIETGRALRESETKYRKLFDESSDGLAIIDRHNGSIVDCNKQFVKMTGRSKRTLLSIKIW